MMKVVWLCNVEIPRIAHDLGKDISVFGGWLEQLSDAMIGETEIVFVYPCHDLLSGRNGSYSFYQFDETDCYTVFDSILKIENPDVIHIWGTEFYHSEIMMRALKNNNMEDRAIVSIQGLVSIYSLHYSVGIPERVKKHRTIHELLRRGNIADGEANYRQRGVLEEKTLKNVKNVIGRTDFDYSAVKAINPGINYYFCNEILRPCFYSDNWMINKIERHTIFISQCNYPIKGFHFLIQALTIVKKEFPDVHVYATGPNIIEKANDIFRRSTYQCFIAKLIKENDLQGNVSFLGVLNANQMKDQYLKCNVFVSPSTIENSSNSIGEAMLLGCPIIASNVGGTKNLLIDEKEGLLYPCSEFYILASYIIRLFRDDDFAISLGLNARKHAILTHDFETNYNQINSIYDNVMKVNHGVC